jgi:hypothetical protein
MGQFLKSLLAISISLLLSIPNLGLPNDSDFYPKDPSKANVPLSFLNVFNIGIGVIRNDIVEGENYDLLDQTDSSFIKKERFEEKTTRKKRSSMNDHGDRIKVIGEISSNLPLTTNGAISLQKYPLQALQFAKAWANYASKKTDPFTYLLKVCEDFCNKNNLFVERDWCDRTKNLLQIPLTDREYVDMDKLKALIDEQTTTSAVSSSPARAPLTGPRSIFKAEMRDNVIEGGPKDAVAEFARQNPDNIPPFMQQLLRDWNKKPQEITATGPTQTNDQYIQSTVSRFMANLEKKM